MGDNESWVVCYGTTLMIEKITALSGSQPGDR